MTYLPTARDALSQALTDPKFTRKYWFGCWQACVWAKSDPWKPMFPDGRVANGEVLEIDPPNRLALKWRNKFRPELRDEGFSHATFERDPSGDAAKLAVIHEIDRPNSKFIAFVSNGWPAILCSLKSLLQTAPQYCDPTLPTDPASRSLPSGQQQCDVAVGLLQCMRIGAK
ncbi:SRPBCC domain-containing protein [Rhodopila sp.]|uniref:SRPBCC domain-containing protein n=1 Tax=Rhodopila sp. TaxID=2480087 RepID=UPI003D0CD402